ncbi:ABC transporter ATP-binding protein [Streptomyces sp. NPDC057555]|uniref:ABC transporter ATP-binding protein n=1 Tax=Streptomyces sp. NPDC057555 TaxID=3346166 RepID=UPI003678CC96
MPISAAASAPCIRLRGLHMDFPVPGRRRETARVLHDIDLDIPEGRLTAIVGPSGSGKSTLLHCIAGLEQATAGSIEVLGTDVLSLPPRKQAAFRSENVGFIFQEYNLVSSLTVEDNIALPARLAGHRVPRSRVGDAMSRLGIAQHARRRPDRLSGGERQRVAVARVVANQPRIVFADEPTGALDLKSGHVVLDWLQALPAQGTTVLMVTHDPHAAARADQVVVLGSGQVHAVIPGGDSHAVSDAVLAAQSEDEAGEQAS